MRVAPGSGRAPLRPLDVSKACDESHKLRMLVASLALRDHESLHGLVAQQLKMA